MHFAIWTKNKPKSQAVEHVLATSPYTQGATYSTHAVSSNVPDMPTSLRELRDWAYNRAIYCRRECPDADYFVGMEWGVYQDMEGENYWIIGIVYIENRDGKGHFWYSCHLEVPEKVVECLFDGRGRDLEEIMHALWTDTAIGDKGGSFAEWTDGILTRKEQFIMATQCALAPHFNQFYHTRYIS